MKNNIVYVNDFKVIKYNQIWNHTEKRICDAEIKSNNDLEKFNKLMIARLKKIQNMEKLYYAMAVLKERNHEDLIDIYESKIIMKNFIDEEI